MEFKSLFLGIVAMVAVCDARQLRATIETPSRRGAWRRKASLSISVPKTQRGGSMGKPSNKLTHSVSLNHLNLAPGQTKVIKQTLVVRRRPNANKNPTHGRKSPSSGRRGSGRRAMYSARFSSGPGQRGAHPTNQPRTAGHPTNGLYLLSKLQHGRPMMGQRAGMATLHLPVIGAVGIGPTRSSPVSGNAGHAPSHHGNTGHGSANNLFGAAHDVNNVHRNIPNSRFGGASVSVNDLINAGVSQDVIARALLAGNPNVVVIQNPVSTPNSVPAAAGQNTNILPASLIRNNNNMPGAYSQAGAGHSNLNSLSKASTVIIKARTLAPPRTTVEPGEDPAEI